MDMSDITAEKRLEIIRSIREENTKNRMNLQSRESILYGRHSTPLTAAGGMQDTGAGAVGKRSSSLGLRILTALVLFSLFLILERTGGAWFSVSADSVRSLLQENYIINVFDFAEEITYTLNHAE